MRVLSCRRLLVLAVVLSAVVRVASGQMMPGAPAEKPQAAPAKPGTAVPASPPAKPQTVEEQHAAVQKKIEEEEATGFRKLTILFFHEHSPYRSVLLAVVTLVVLLVLKKHTTRLMRRYAETHAQNPENVQRFLKTWHTLWKFVIGVFVILALSGSLKLMGLSAAFLGMMLGWSLQAPVTGLAA